MDAKLLIIFVKAPRLGFVKTRIAEKLGDASALVIYQRTVTALVTNLSRLNDVEMRFAPDDAASEIDGWLKPAWRSEAQGRGGLGERLIRAFAEAFQRGCERVVVIGSDAPEVSEKDIYDAWEALRNADAVIGPAADGGYWLIGLQAEHPELFEGISWSTPEVLKQTLAIAERRGLKVRELRELSDIDTVEDWNAYLSRQGQRE